MPIIPKWPRPKPPEPSPQLCKACEGVGTSSRGQPCFPCNGTGKEQTKQVGNDAGDSIETKEKDEQR